MDKKERKLMDLNFLDAYIGCRVMELYLLFEEGSISRDKFVSEVQHFCGMHSRSYLSVIKSILKEDI